MIPFKNNPSWQQVRQQQQAAAQQARLDERTLVYAQFGDGKRLYAHLWDCEIRLDGLS